MVDDAGAAQARLLLEALYEHVDVISDTLEEAEQRAARLTAHAAAHCRVSRPIFGASSTKCTGSSTGCTAGSRKRSSTRSEPSSQCKRHG